MVGRPPVPPAIRFRALTTHVGSCLVWQGSVTNSGYGRFKMGGKTRLAHRVAYELLRGPIPAGLTIDHQCNNKLCVRVAHLRAVPIRANLMRAGSQAPAYLNAQKTHCKHGHKFDVVNTYRRWDGARGCRACRKRIDATRYQQIRLEDD